MASRRSTKTTNGASADAMNDAAGRSPYATALRSVTCGSLTAKAAGERVVLTGWVAHRRDYGKLIFIDLRDRYGLTQVVFDSTVAPEAHAVASQARSEYVLQVRGLVGKRPEEAIRRGGR